MIRNKNRILRFYTKIFSSCFIPSYFCNVNLRFLSSIFSAHKIT
nr:MAG TPA: hypothetical protein [Bacteriophage sp.]DAI57847.1 MAG TPA: hypothetical protein [Caudoviricetes sp.]